MVLGHTVHYRAPSPWPRAYYSSLTHAHATPRGLLPEHALCLGAALPPWWDALPGSLLPTLLVSGSAVIHAVALNLWAPQDGTSLHA